MPKSVSIEDIGLEAHYALWLQKHPDAIAYKQLVHYFEHGDEFGRKVPLSVYMQLTGATKNTILKWLRVWNKKQKENKT